MFEHFFTRKVTLIKHADACVFFPGGFGTADELMEVLTLVQTRKGKDIKIFLFGIDFWTPLIEWFKRLEAAEYINQVDLDSFCMTDDINQILTEVKE